MMMNVRVLVRFCGSVQSTVYASKGLCVSCRSFSGMNWNRFEGLDSFENKHLLCWAMSCGRMMLALSLIFVQDYTVDVWELRKARLCTCGENTSGPQSQSQNSSSN